MSALKRNLETIWSQLRSQKSVRANSLEELYLKGLRGIMELRIPFPFPVTVLAGPNGCGKSTILFALACAYRSLDAGERHYTPAALFPDFRPRKKNGNQLSDVKSQVEITFSYITANERLSMKWKRGKDKWGRSFFGKI